MPRRLAAVLALVAAAGLIACGGASFQSVRTATSGQSIAVVSLAINDYGDSLQGWNDTRTSDLMTSRAAAMVQMAEERLAAHWGTVVPAASFAADPRLQQMATAHDVAVPFYDGVPLPTLARDRGALVGTRLAPDQTAALAEITGADLFVVIYAEWGVVTGGFVPTSKALSKNVVSICDAAGQQRWQARKDTRGDRTLGAFGRVVVDENSVDEWVDAYGEGLDLLFR